MTYREALIEIARIAYESGIVDEIEIKKMLYPLHTNTKKRNYYRLMDVLNRRKDGVGNIKELSWD